MCVPWRGRCSLVLHRHTFGALLLRLSPLGSQSPHAFFLFVLLLSPPDPARTLALVSRAAASPARARPRRWPTSRRPRRSRRGSASRRPPSWRAAVAWSGEWHTFHRLTSTNMSSPTGQACKNSTRHWPARDVEERHGDRADQRRTMAGAEVTDRRAEREVPRGRVGGAARHEHLGRRRELLDRLRRLQHALAHALARDGGRRRRREGASSLAL